MTDRVVKVTIQASIANYVSGMEKVRKATADAAKESEKLEKFGQAATSVGTALLGIGAVATGAAAVVVKMAADFDAQMSKVQAATGATSAEMSKFREQALTAGAQFGYTATEVTEAQVELGKAGVSTSSIMSGLSGVLGLAASDNLDLGQATQIAAVAMTQFGKVGSDIPHIADLLAAGAGKALGGVDQLGQALNQSGQVANQFGLSIEDTVGTLSAFAGAGLLGSDAGTSFKTMLQSLANPAKQTKDLMAQLGLNFYDANGKFVGISAAAQELHDKLSGLTDQQRQQALAQIFGSDAVRAATVLYNEQADGIDKWVAKVDDSGYALEQAAKKSDNLNGDLKKLQSAFQSGLIEAGSAADGALRPLVQTMTQVVTAFNGLPEPVKGSALALTAVVGGASLLAGGLLVAIPKIVEFRAALATLAAGGVTGRAALGSVASFLGGPWGAALAVGAIAVAAFVGPQLEAAKRTKEFVGTLDSVTGAVTKTTSALVASNLATKGTFLGIEVGPSTFDQAKKAGISLQTVQKAAEGNTKAYRELKAAVGDLNDARGVGNISENRAAVAGNSVLKSVEEQRAALGAAKDQTTQMAQAQDASADASGKAASGLDSVTDSAEDATQAISDTADALRGLTSGQLDVNATARDFEQSIDDATKALAENRSGLNDTHDGFKLTEQAGRDASAAVDDLAQKALNSAGALYQQTGSQQQATAALQAGRDELVKQLVQYGFTEAGAKAYADQVVSTPTDWATKFNTNASGQPSSDVDSLHQKIVSVPLDKETVLKAEIASAWANLDLLKRKIGEVPPAKSTQLRAEVAAAKANLASLQTQLNNIQTQKTITITTNRVNVATPENTNGVFKNKASGGYISGPGTATSDSIPARLSNGEFVVKASSVRKYGVGFLDAVNTQRFADGGLVSTRTTQDRAAKNRFKAAQEAQRKAQSAFNKEKSARNRQRLLNAQQETRDAKIVAQRAAAALTAAKNAPTGADQGDRLSFRSSVRAGEYSSSDAVRDLYAMGQDSGKYSRTQRTRFLDVANRSELAMLKLQKQSDAASKSVEAASDKLGDLKSSAASMSSAVSGKLSDFSFGNYRSGSSLLRGLTSRAGKLKQFQSLLVTLQKNGLAPALLNEIASLGVDEGLPLAKSLAAMSKGQLSAINSQYGSIGKTSTAIGNQVADANYGKLIDAAERQLSAANKNADKIAKAISDQSKSLQKLVGKALGLPGYSTGGYTGDFGTGQVAGLVHGREFVMNAHATAANRPLLEAMNQGGNVRYMDPRRVASAAPAVARERVLAPITVQPAPDLDAHTVGVLAGREMARYLDGVAG